MKLAVIGDVHSHWSVEDSQYFNQGHYDALLFVGDLGTLRPGRDVATAKELAKLTCPAFLIPGNHDATSIPGLLSEIAGAPVAAPGTGGRHQRRMDKFREALGPVTVTGYSVHELRFDGEAVDLLSARPHAMGGGLNFAPYLRREFGVRTMAESTKKLKDLVDESRQERIVFLGHNGPAGLGEAADSMFGCDFKREACDWGDPDLAAAIQYAREQGKTVLCVLAGHMHHRTKQGKQRPWSAELDGTLYLNAAKVPRNVKRGRSIGRHHLALTISGHECTAEERFIV